MFRCGFFILLVLIFLKFKIDGFSRFQGKRLAKS